MTGTIDANLPRVRILASEFLALGEYSCTIPTGVIPGKRWRRLHGSFDERFIRAGGKPRWVIGEYQAIPGDDTQCRVVWSKPVIVCPPAEAKR